MNPLPQRKKSPEEIAKLRESLGVPPDLADAEAPVESPEPQALPGPNNPNAGPPPDAMTPVDDDPPHVHARPQFRSFKRSERLHEPLPQPEIEARREASDPASEPSLLPRVPVIPVAGSRQARPVRSLKRSEQAPAPAPLAPAADSQLPVHRHTEQELAEARRRDALAVMEQGVYQIPGAAHPALLAIGYVLAIGGAAAPSLLDGLVMLTGDYRLGQACSQGYHVLTGCTLAALPIAGFIHCRKTLSRHHAAFIAVIVFFALVFAVLHYFFPQLRHAT